MYFNESKFVFICVFVGLSFSPHQFIATIIKVMYLADYCQRVDIIQRFLEEELANLFYFFVLVANILLSMFSASLEVRFWFMLMFAVFIPVMTVEKVKERRRRS